MEILERSRYTITLSLSYFFNENGIRIAETSVESIGHIIEGVNRIHEKINEISVHLPRQLSINDEVNKAVVDMREVSEMIGHVMVDQGKNVNEILQSVSRINESQQFAVKQMAKIIESSSTVARLSESLKEKVSFFRGV